jgi:serine/threonine-protein phosphatase 2A regulatory subunit B
MEKEGDQSGGWRFAQCFGDKGEVEEITEGESSTL